MPLTAHGRADARRVVLAASAGCLFAIVVAAATWWLVERQRLAQEMARYGEALAEDVALLAAEPLRRDDRIGLGLAVARLVERPEVRGIAVHTEQGQPFVAAGNIASTQIPAYSRRVLAERATIGQVRAALNPASFRPTATSHLIAAAVAAAALLIVFGAASALARHWPALDSLASRAIAKAAQEDELGAAEPDPQPQAAEQAQYGVVANLFHRASMADDERRAALRLAHEAAARAAALYSGEAASLPRVGAVMTFAGPPDRRAFDAVCAALVLRDVLNDPALVVEGLFRYAVDSIPASSGATDQSQRGLLLSSLAPNGALVIGKDAYSALVSAGVLEVAPLDNRAVQALAPTVPQGIVFAVRDQRQAATLARQAAAIATALGAGDDARRL